MDCPISDNKMCRELVFYMDDPSPVDYSQFLEDLRSSLTYYTLKTYKLSVLCPTSCVNPHRYSMVDLFYTDKTLTLALDVVDLSLVAFKFENKASFFANTKDLKCQFFTETEITKVDLTYSNTFDVSNLGLRNFVAVGKLELYLAFNWLTFNGVVPDQNMKTSLSTVIGMVCEAARFRVIEDAITSAFDVNKFYSIKMISYAENWVSLSENIHKANKCGKFPTPVNLTKDDSTIMKVTNVGQVQGKMGILIKSF